MPKTFDPATEIPDLQLKVIVITGGNAGLGAETVRKLAAHNPATIYCCARTPSKVEAMAAEIREYSRAIIMPVELDLSDLESVKTAANAILTSSMIDILYLNAGIAATAPKLTAQGYEEQFGVNHVGHALFTQMLLPKMLMTAEHRPPRSVRIVVLSSRSHADAVKPGIAFDELKSTMTSMGSMSRYAQSKLANVLFAKKLAGLYPSIVIPAVHPGVVSTEIMNKCNGVGFLLSMIIPVFVALMSTSVEEGAKTQLWAGTADDVKSGEYYEPIGKTGKDGAYANDAKLMDELWEWTDKELKTHGGPGWPAAK